MNSCLYRQTLENIDKAVNEFLASGGVVQYTMNSGQGSTTVRVDNLQALTEARKHYLSLYNEAIQFETGSNINIMRGF